MLRARLSEDLKTAMRAREQRAVSTIRMILAELKLRDIAAREKGNAQGVGEAEIVDMMQKLVRQRRDSIAAYEKGGRQDLAQQEAEEIAVIERYLPKGLSDEEAVPTLAACAMSCEVRRRA